MSYGYDVKGIDSHERKSKIDIKVNLDGYMDVIGAFEWILNVEQVYFIQKLTQRTKISTDKGEFSNGE